MSEFVCVYLSVCPGRISKTVQRIWLKLCTGTEVCPSQCVSHSGGDRLAGVTPGESKMWFSEVDSNRQSFSRLFLCPCSLLTVGLRRKNQFVYDDDDDDDDDDNDDSTDLCCQ